MKISTYHSYDELPLFFNAELVAKVLGVSISSAYELMHEEVLRCSFFMVSTTILLNSGVYRLFGTPFGIAKHPTC